MDIDWGDEENVPPTRARSPDIEDIPQEFQEGSEATAVNSDDATAQQTEEFSESFLTHRRKAPKRLKTLRERDEERALMLEKFEEEFQVMRPESGVANERSFPTMLRSDEMAMVQGKESLPQTFLNQVWMRVLETEVNDTETAELSVFDVEALAAGLSPDRALPPDPLLEEVKRMMAAIMRPDGTYIFPNPRTDVILPGEEGLDVTTRLRRRYAVLAKREETLTAVAQDEQYQLRRRRGMAGIPELARVLASCNPLWRRWWHRDFPRQVNEYGTRLWAANHLYVPAYMHDSARAPRPPAWILGQQASEEGTITESQAAVEAQYTDCAWRRFYAWTQFFERRCYRLIMEIEEARADAYSVEVPRYNPHGVYTQPPVRPDRWLLQSAEQKSVDQPGDPYYGWARYNIEGVDDRMMNLDRIALLLPETTVPDIADDTELSAPVLAYLALRHAGDGVDEVTLDGPCRSFASLPWANENGASYRYNFIDHYPKSEQSWSSREERTDKYSAILLSYILWSVVTVELQERQGPPFSFSETLEQVRQRAQINRLPIRLDLLEPLEQAILLNLYIPKGDNDTGMEGSWPLLEALPVLPMRGMWSAQSILRGNGGVRFVGKQMRSAKEKLVV